MKCLILLLCDNIVMTAELEGFKYSGIYQLADDHKRVFLRFYKEKNCDMS